MTVIMSPRRHIPYHAFLSGPAHLWKQLDKSQGQRQRKSEMAIWSISRREGVVSSK